MILIRSARFLLLSRSVANSLSKILLVNQLIRQFFGDETKRIAVIYEMSQANMQILNFESPRILARVFHRNSIRGILMGKGLSQSAEGKAKLGMYV